METMDWEEVSSMRTKPRGMSLEYGGKELEIQVRNLGMAEMRKLRAEAMSEGGDDREILFSFAHKCMMRKVVSIAGHEMGEDDWENVDSDLQTALMWTLNPYEMGLSVGPTDFLKNLSEG